MSNAVVRRDGLAIKLMFRTHEGMDLELECPPAAALEIVTRLAAALESAVKHKRPTEEAMAHGFHTDRYALSAALEGPPALLMHFFPMPDCPIGIHLHLDVADKLAADLPSAVATIRKGLPTAR